MNIIEDKRLTAYMPNNYNIVASNEDKAIYLKIEQYPKELIDITDNILQLLVLAGIEKETITFEDIEGNLTKYKLKIKQTK